MTPKFVNDYFLIMLPSMCPNRKSYGHRGQALVTFIEYSYAFDSISHVQLLDIMLELGFPEHIVALLHSLYIIPANRYGFPVSSTNFCIDGVIIFFACIR